MTTGQYILWSCLMLVGFIGSALYSGMETGCYRINRVRLHVRATQGFAPAVRLERMIERPTSLLSTLLIGNNITNYLGTASLAVMLSASGLSETQQHLLNTVLVTPMLFVFGETLPKDLFAAHADALMYRLQRVLFASKMLFTAVLLVPIVGLFSGGVMRLIGQGGSTVFHPRRRVGDLVKEGVGSGLLSDHQSVMVERVLGTAGLTVASRMTPWKQAVWVRTDASAQQVRGLIEEGAGPWLPVVGDGGKISAVLDGPAHVAAAESDTAPKCDPMRPALCVPSQTPLRRVLTRMRQEGAWLVIVTDDADKPVGTATLHQLLQPITGPLPT